MSAHNISVDCRYTQDGNDFQILLFQSFRFFLERELKNNNFRFAFSKAARL